MTATFNAVCHAVRFNLYRRTGTPGAWARVGTLDRAARAPAFDNGTGPIVLSITDNGGAGTAAAPPATNGATLTPYSQNPGYVPALQGAGIATVASDSSKPYPNPPTKANPSEADPTNFAKGATFPLAPGPGRPALPDQRLLQRRQPADQLDEYNWIYTKAPRGNCTESPASPRATPL